jgi:uncharacterized membrane protein YhaH (DUF805 family)
MLTVDPNFCYTCNAPQTEGFVEFETKKSSDNFLKVLCGLTIAGGIISILSSIVSLLSGAAFPIEGMEIVTSIAFVVAIAKLVAAIFMLKKRLLGLYIYSAAAAIGIIVQMYSVSLTRQYTESIMQGGGTIVIISTVFAVLIVITFLILYWLPENRRHLS